MKDHENYHSAHFDALDWIRKTRISVQECGDCHGEKQVTLDKQWKINEIVKTLPAGEFEMCLSFFWYGLCFVMFKGFETKQKSLS